MADLINQKCVGHKDMKLLTEVEIKDYLSQLNPVRNSPPTGPSGAQSAGAISNGVKEGWQLMESPPSHKASEGHFAKLQKQFSFSDFARAMEFVNKVADIAEKEGHHPDVSIHYNKVEVVLWSHFVKGLSVNDFIIASKIDQIT